MPPLPVAEVDRYFWDLVGACPVGVVGFAVSPVSGIRAAEGSGLLFTVPWFPETIARTGIKLSARTIAGAANNAPRPNRKLRREKVMLIAFLAADIARGLHLFDPIVVDRHLVTQHIEGVVEKRLCLFLVVGRKANARGQYRSERTFARPPPASASFCATSLIDLKSKLN